MEKLLTYDGKKLMIDGVDLGELANMYHLSIPLFFLFVEDYLTSRGLDFKPNCIINNNDSVKIEEPLPPKAVYIDGRRIVMNDVTSNIVRVKNSELLVPSENIEIVKERIFDLAYIKCSNIGDKNWDHWSLDSSNAYSMNQHLLRKQDCYSCIYGSARGGFNEKMSDVPIDYKDREARLRLIRK